jgi:HD-GYP domain-containing protein (c-di-GMP phosphodiesterase class II)
LVHDHHERLDGCGYPRGRSAESLGRDTRILTVCDVYDALITPRVYRPAWTHAEAIALLRTETGTAFDGRCVSALEELLARESGAESKRSDRRPAAAPATAPVPASVWR